MSFAASASRVAMTFSSAEAIRAWRSDRSRSSMTEDVPRARSASPCRVPSAEASISSRRLAISAAALEACASRVTSSRRRSRSRALEPTSSPSRRPAPAFEAVEPGGEERAARDAEVGLDVGVTARRDCLAFQRPHLATHLAHQVAQAFDVLLGGGQSALGALFATAMLQDPGRLFDDRATILRRGVEDGSPAGPDR